MKSHTNTLAISKQNRKNGITFKETVCCLTLFTEFEEQIINYIIFSLGDNLVRNQNYYFHPLVKESSLAYNFNDLITYLIFLFVLKSQEPVLAISNRKFLTICDN